MIVLTAVVFGVLSYRLLPINMMPEITYPSITVRTEYPGAAPEEVETTVTRPLEQALGVVRNLVEMTSSSRAEYSDVLLEFDWDIDMNQATQDVREKLDLVFLPDDVKPPLILRYDPSLDPLMRIGMTSDSLDLLDLRNLCEDLVKLELEKLSGVAAVKVKGGEEDEIRVAVDADKLDMLNLTVGTLVQRLASENINIAGGRLSEGESEFIIRTLNEFQTVEEIGQVAVISRYGQLIRLSDIATVTRTSKERTSLTRVAEQESVELEIYKESDANPINVSELVKKRIFGWRKQDKKKDDQGKSKQHKRGGIQPLSKTLTERVNIYILSDQAEFIRLAVDEVKSAAILGGILAVIVLLLFLGRLRDTLIIAIVIPVSLVCAFAAMHIAHVSINIMSLGGLALGIGMMVDNAIVVIESIHRRREKGDSPVAAAVIGTRTVGAAVTASTLTTVVVFFPIVFVTGIAGQVFGDMALTVIIALSVSLIVALFFVPMLVTLGANRKNIESQESQWGRPRIRFVQPWRQFRSGFSRWWKMGIIKRLLTLVIVPIYLILRILTGYLFLLIQWLIYLFLALDRIIYRIAIVKIFRWLSKRSRSGSGVFQNGMTRLTDIYAHLLSRLLPRPWPILILVVLICVLSYSWILPQMGSELIPSVSQGIFEVEFKLPVGTSLERTAQVIAPIELKVASLKGVVEVSSRSGGDPTGAEKSKHGPNFAIMTVVLESGGDIEAREARIVSEIRSIAHNIPSLEILITHPTLFTFKQPIELIIKDDDLARLRNLTRKVEARLLSLPILADVESSVRTGHPEVVIRFNRDRLARLGITARSAAERIKSAILGTVPTRYREEERRIDIRVQWDESDRESLHQLRNLVINPDQPVPVTLEEAAELSMREGPAEIRHYSGIRAAVITASVQGADLKTADLAIHKILDEFKLNEGYDYTISGQRREMKDSLGSLRMALLLAIFLVYVVMASQFESFKSPFLILLTIPLAAGLVIPVLWGLSMPLSVMVFLGLIVLVGIVVNDSIVLVDYTNQLIRSGEGVDSAIVNAARARIRPILMTTITTVLALLPMAIGVGEGVEIRRPMAVTVIFGLTFATVVTLVVIPLLYRLVNKK